MPDDYPVFLFEYDHAGAQWSLQITAKDFNDARERLNKLPLARYVGILHAEIPAAVPGAGWLVRLWCWWKNWRGESHA